MNRIYFAHCMADYGNAREAAALAMLKLAFPSVEIINPTSYQQDFNDWRESSPSNELRPMQYWTDLVKDCDALAYLWSEDDAGEFVLGAGVAQEILTAHVWEKPVFEIAIVRDEFGGIGASLEIGTPFSAVLSISETRELIAQETPSDN